MSVLDKARELGAEILQSQELNDMKNAELAMINDVEAQKIIDQFKDKQRTYQAVKAEGGELSEDQQKEVEDLEQKMLENQLILEYFKTQQSFEQMLEEINNIIAGAISGSDCNCSDDCCTSCDEGCSH